MIIRRKRTGNSCRALRITNDRFVFLAALALVLLLLCWQDHPQKAEFKVEPALMTVELATSKRQNINNSDFASLCQHGSSHHGTFLIDSCVCDVGYQGSYCNETSIMMRHSTKCRFNPKLDSCATTPGIGRFRVSSTVRLQQARDCESNYWGSTSSSVPIRNHDQVLAFDSFQGLQNINDAMNLGHVLEIGAGPYTKTKLLLDTRLELSVSHVTLVDPLLQEYQTNPNITTTYSSGNLLVRNGEFIPTTLLQASGEDLEMLPTNVDTVILVNTLEHCSNAVSVLNNAYQVMKDDSGVLIFGESFATEMATTTLGSDACHPIQLYKSFLLRYLNTYYHPTIMAPRTGGTSGLNLTHEGAKQSLYAIVRKKKKLKRHIHT